MEIANKSQAENGTDNTTIMTPLRVKQSIAANGGSGGTTNYEDLTNKPTINNVELSGNKTSTSLGLQPTLVSGTNIKTVNNETLLGSGNISISGGTATNVKINGTSITSSGVADIKTKGTYNASTNKIATVADVPTKTSDITNDSNFVSDSSYVHTDNNYTSTEKNKLSGIASGAEVNVQSDWNETNSSSDAYIKNKPDFTYIDSEISNLWDGENYLAESTIRKLIGTSETPINLNEFTYEDEDFGVLETRGIYAIKGRIVIGDETFDLPNYGIFVVNSWESNEKVVQYFGGELSGVYNVQRTQSGGTYTYTYTFDPYHTWEQFESDLDIYLLNELSYYLENDLKTINNTSIVGSGNISVQPTLVSGTNIKTVNNTSLLGSGNINISGGEKGLEELTSPVYIENTADGAYRVPTGCVIGTYTADKGGILLVTSKTIDSHLVKFWYLIDSVGDVAFDGDNSELLDYDINFKYGVACEDTGDEWEHDLISISDLVNVQANWNETNSSSAAYIKNKPTLSTVATSGSYNDLSNKPTIPTQTSQLTNNSGFITKSVNNLDNYTLSSSLKAVATSGSYNDLSNKPTIPTVNNGTLTIQKNGSTIDTFTANSSTNKTVNITVDTFTHETVYLDELD